MWKQMALLVMIGSMMMMACACSMSDSSKEKLADLDFTVVDEIDLPQEIKTLLEEKKGNEFRVVFTAKENMYIAVGYGAKDTSGYSIAVNELYQSTDSICIKTSLIPPAKGENVVKQTTYPYIVVMLENMDCPVIFD